MCRPKWIGFGRRTQCEFADFHAGKRGMPLRELEPDVRAVRALKLDPSIHGNAVRRRLQVPARVATGAPTMKSQLASRLRQSPVPISYQRALQVLDQPGIHIYQQRKFILAHRLRLLVRRTMPRWPAEPHRPNVA